MDHEAVITIGALPIVFNLTGADTYENDSYGLKIELDGSETYVDYQLLLDGNAIGSPLNGTGSTLDFGFYTSPGTYTVSANRVSSGCKNKMDGSLALSAERPFISTWTTTTDRITLPLNGVGIYDFNVRWFKKDDVSVNGNTISDSYLPDNRVLVGQPGDYILLIKGDLPRLLNSSQLLEVNQWGDIEWEYLRIFQNSSALLLAQDAPDLSNCTSLNKMFSGSSINVDLSGWDVSNVQDMSGMFQDAVNFNGNISNWKPSSAINMSYMFHGASAFNQDLNNWEVDLVEDMSHMFEEASNFNGNISSWTVDNVLDMSYMFFRAEDFNQDLNSWNVSSVTNMEKMFYEADNFNGNITSWVPSAVTDMNGMFNRASNFNQNISNWNVGNVEDMSSMFRNASSFNQNISTWNFESVQEMNQMFSYASSFDQNIGNWNIQPGISMDYILKGTGISVDNYDQTLIDWSLNPNPPTHIRVYDINQHYCSSAASSARSYLRSTISSGGLQWVIDDDGQFCPNGRPFITKWDSRLEWSSLQITIPIDNSYNYRYKVSWVGVTNPSLSGELSTIFTSNAIITLPEPGEYLISITGEFPKIHFYDSDELISIEQWGDYLWTDFVNSFGNCPNLAEINAVDILDLSQTEDMQSMFQNAASFNGNIDNWDVSNVQRMTSMFAGAVNFNNNIGSWNVGNVEDMSYMFKNASSFNQDISTWNVESVQQMTQMFSNASSFNQDLGSWDISNVTQNIGIFVTSMSDMLNNSGLSRENYDNTLVGWATLDPGETQIPTGITLGADGLYYCNSETERGILIDALNGYDWTISGDALNCSMAAPSSARISEESDESNEDIILSEESLNIELTLYPNPANEEVYLIGDIRGAVVHIYDLNGKEVLHEANDQDTSLNLNSSVLDDGIYLMRIELVSGEVEERKLVIKH